MEPSAQQPPNESNRESPAAPGAGRFRVWQCLSWLVTAAGIGAAAAWMAFIAQRYYAPWILFPLLVGVVLGGFLVLAMRILNAGHRPTVVTGTLAAVLLAVVGQHYISFWTQRRAADETPQQQMAQLLFPEKRPASDFGEFIVREAARGRHIGGIVLPAPWAWASWGLDALLVLIPAMLLSVTAARLPYCNRCRSYYRTIRSRRIDLATARRLADLVDVPNLAAAEFRAPRCRLIACREGCGPTGLVLFWSDAAGGLSSGYIWLDAPQRNRVLEALDGEPGAGSSP